MWRERQQIKKKDISLNKYTNMCGCPEGGRKGGMVEEKKRAQRARRGRGTNPGAAAC